MRVIAPRLALVLPLLLSGAAQPNPPAVVVQTLSACAGMSGVNETCTISLQGAACTTQPCRRLVVIFSGGDMGCTKGDGYAQVLANYSSHGWAAACINYFETPDGSGTVPYYREHDRLSLAVAAVTTGEWARFYWTGEQLLLEGISHGASSPLITMARFGVDAQPSWQGTAATAGCFFDGSVDQAATAALLKTGAVDGGPCTYPVPYDRWLSRYCPGAPSECDLATNSDALLDNVVDAPSSNFTLRTWRLTECGSNLRPCTGDIIPMAPFEAMCAGINNATTKTSCEFHRLPDDSHLTCHASYAWECREWFEGMYP